MPTGCDAAGCAVPAAGEAAAPAAGAAATGAAGLGCRHGSSASLRSYNSMKALLGRSYSCMFSTVLLSSGPYLC